MSSFHRALKGNRRAMYLWAGMGCGVVVAAVLLASCTGVPTAFLVNGPAQTGNVAPTLAFLEPTSNITRGQGEPFLIRWTDSDPDDNAKISFSLVNTNTNILIPLVQGLDENDLTGPDSFAALTTLIPVGTYNLLGTIIDSANPAVQVFAPNVDGQQDRLVVQIAGQGEGPPTAAPVVAVVAPTFDLSVTQDDILTVVVQPLPVQPDPPTTPFDRDSDTILYLVLDTDRNPNNDDPTNTQPDPSKIVVLQTVPVAVGATSVAPFQIRIDLTKIPARPDGSPYFVRATISDGVNPPVHSYAPGTISIVQLAAGTVDLSLIGRTTSGATFLGFNPGANVGSKVIGVRDFDLDGTDDFIIAAQYGNPRNAGPVGEAYLVYGQDKVRFGGVQTVNSVSETIAGAIFEAPPVRQQFICANTGNGKSNGIVDVNFLPDLSGDGRPELIFGMSYVEGMFDSIDFDPGDEDLTNQGSTDAVAIEVIYSRNLITVQVDNGTPQTTSTSYDGVADTFISSAQPSTNFGSSLDVTWQNAGAGNRSWGLIKFQDVFLNLPDSELTVDFTSFTARLRMTISNTGGGATLHGLITNFTEQTRFSNFTNNGGEPQAGVDYLAASLGNIDATSTSVVEVDVTARLQQLLADFQNGNLIDDTIAFIIVPSAGAADDASVRSSEGPVPIDRPQLVIDYNRLNPFADFGCYPDLLVNNLTDSEGVDAQWYSGGAAVIVNSQNRDSDGGPTQGVARLENTSVNLELSGQRRFFLDSGGVNNVGGNIFPRADNNAADVPGNDVQEPGRIAGARFIAGPYDCVDAFGFQQPGREDSFGETVGALGDVNNDGLPEVMISSPTNEKYLKGLLDTYGPFSTHFQSTIFNGSIVVLPGNNYNNTIWRDLNDSSTGTSTIPSLDQSHFTPFGQCSDPSTGRHLYFPTDAFAVFAESVEDHLGGARSAGDFNQDGLDDIACGAYLNDRPGIPDAGAVYVIYSRSVSGDFDLKLASDPARRPPMLRIRGKSRGDQIGWRQTSGLDVNGDRIDDVFFSSPRTDFGGITRTSCAGDFNDDGTVGGTDLSLATFTSCADSFGAEVFSNDSCKVFDYDNDGDIDDSDKCVFCCLSDSCEPDASCIHGLDPNNCCANLVDNGFVGIVFGGRLIDGDRDIAQLAASELPGVVFFGGHAGDRAGVDITSAGDFNQDGFGDILIAVPGEVRIDGAGRERVGAVYLIFGGTHLENTRWDLSDPNRGVGSSELPGIVFLSPFVKGRPNEAAPTTVGFLGDINNDGFGDIAVGNPKADFIDLSFPQGPDAPGSDPAAGRRSDAGNAYIIYGNNFGSNRSQP